MTRVPQRYIPRTLSRRDKMRQTQYLRKSRKLYKKGKYFVESYDYIILNDMRAPNGEFYVSNTYQAMIKLGYKIGIYELFEGEIYYPVGEPLDYYAYFNAH